MPDFDFAHELALFVQPNSLSGVGDGQQQRTRYAAARLQVAHGRRQRAQTGNAPEGNVLRHILSGLRIPTITTMVTGPNLPAVGSDYDPDCCLAAQMKRWHPLMGVLQLALYAGCAQVPVNLSQQ